MLTSLTLIHWPSPKLCYFLKINLFVIFWKLHLPRSTVTYNLHIQFFFSMQRTFFKSAAKISSGGFLVFHKHCLLPEIFTDSTSSQLMSQALTSSVPPALHTLPDTILSPQPSTPTLLVASGNLGKSSPKGLSCTALCKKGIHVGGWFPPTSKTLGQIHGVQMR